MNAKQRSTTYHANALARGLHLLQLLAEDREPVTLADLHERSQLPKSTLVRLLSVMTDLSYVRRVDERPAFQLGVSVLTLASGYVDKVDLEDLAESHLRELAALTGHTANLGTLDGQQVLHLAVIEPDRPIRYTASKGLRDAPYCTGLGKMLLASQPRDRVATHLPTEPFARRTPNTLVTMSELLKELDQIAEQGYAYDDEEGDEGVRCLAVPVTIDDTIVAALSVAGPAGELTPQRHAKIVGILRDVAEGMVSDRELAGALSVVHRQFRSSGRILSS